MLVPSPSLESLLRQSPDIWSGGQVATRHSRSTGFRALNDRLPGHGWPLGLLVELMPMAEGIGELRLVLPALKQLCHEARDIVLVRPPHVPYPPGLAQAGLPLNRIIWIEAQSDDDARWAAEQTLREGMAGAVLLWSDCHKDISLRRLQLAAREGEALAFLYRSPGHPNAASPAAVRLALQATPLDMDMGMRIDVLKAQGGRVGSTLLHSLAA